MTQRVVLNNIDHGDLRIMPRFGEAFGHQTNSVHLFPTEYAEAAREYAILFRRQEDTNTMFAVALLGLDRDENLFLDGEEWDARYIPAIHARGPFSIGVQRDADGQPKDALIHVDLDDVRVGSGYPLFLPQGGNTPLLDRVAEVLQTIAAGLEIEPAMFAAFAAEGLVQPVQLQIETDATRRYNLVDFFTVDAGRLAALEGDALERLHRAGFLGLAFAVASSLGNIDALIARKTRAR
jgi:hypothetical protein